MFEVELLLQAENELSEAYDWYEERQSGLGARLFDEVSHYLNLLENNPFQFPVRYTEGLRVTPVKVFPYIIIYWIEEPANKVFVTSIFHTSRNPQRR